MVFLLCKLWYLKHYCVGDTIVYPWDRTSLKPMHHNNSNIICSHFAILRFISPKLFTYQSRKKATFVISYIKIKHTNFELETFTETKRSPQTNWLIGHQWRLMMLQCEDKQSGRPSFCFSFGHQLTKLWWCPGFKFESLIIACAPLNDQHMKIQIN